MYNALAAMLQNGESVPVTVTGRCMSPLLREGQRLSVQKRGRYFTGDILVFAAAGGELLVHRYLGPVPTGRLMTKADTAARIDALVSRDHILGRVLSADGIPVTTTVSARARAALQYLRWLAVLLAARIQRHSAFRFPLD